MELFSSSDMRKFWMVVTKAFIKKNRTSRVKCWTANFCIHGSEGPDIIIR